MARHGFSLHVELRLAPRADATRGFRLPDALAVACHLFELAAIEHDDVAPFRPDDLRGFQCMEGFRAPRPAHTEHDGTELVRERRVVAIKAVVAHQQPAQPAVVSAVADQAPWRSKARHQKGSCVPLEVVQALNVGLALKPVPAVAFVRPMLLVGNRT